ncbi:type I polyketide synthase [Streptomyces sp. KMM 9044]|uniref:type I polyketide synthase n=1 Tax=Streptomyces sp. KMM 9044 TaxID=2744474 RepID=UPI00215097B9|nr:type I polyketide synthase [Streptomyces sp. KMM 9044]WAX76552.1 type I polyketide synthase [Streptomyces sp. KMM 9044]
MNGKGTAVLGYACRVPGGRDVADLWSIVADGRDCVTRASTNVGATTGGRVHAYGVLDDIGLFDAGFFGYSPREAAEIDPQQRLLLECAVEALETAGVRADGLGHDIGVYAATGLSGYLLATHNGQAAADDSLSTLMGSDGHYAATRIAYKLGLTGPAMSVGSACSSSLLAIHTAAQAIAAGECDLALAGGMDVEFPQPVSYLHQEGGIMAQDGVCRPFDAAASGTVFGSGGGLVLLADPDVAEERGWPVRAVLMGSAVNNDGSEKASFTAPRASRQAKAIAQAMEIAEVEPAQVRYVECHGTGTQLGDRSELSALADAFGDTPLPPLGSAKANFGHLRVGAGVVGFIKACEVVAHGVIPPLANLDRPMDALRPDDAPLPRQARALDLPAAERFAGVSSFGFGGTNVHAVVRGHEDTRPATAVSEGPHVLRVSAADPDSCLATAGALAGVLRSAQAPLAADVARTLRDGRDDHAYRLATVGDDPATLAAGLEGAGEHTVEGWHRPGAETLLMLPGQGSDLLPTARALYGWEAVFTTALERLWDTARSIEPTLAPLEAALSATPAETGGPGLPTDHALHTAVLLALAEQLAARGVLADRTVGYSLGEYAAAAVAGVITGEDALRLVVARARVLRDASPGAMIAVRLPADGVAAVLPEDLASPAVTLSADRTAVSLAADALPQVTALLTEAGVPHRVLGPALPYHSSLLAGAAAAFAPVADAVPVRPGSARLVTTAVGRTGLSAGYWSAHLSGPLDLTPAAEAVAEATTGRGCVIVDLSPDGFLARAVEDPAAGAAVRPLRADKDPRVAWLHGLAALWVAGVPADTAPAGRPDGARTIELPARVFSREQHLKEPSSPAGTDGLSQAGGTVRREKSLDRWAYYPSWRFRRRGPGVHDAVGERWLVLAENDGESARVVETLRARGVDCIHLVPDEAGAGRNGDGVFVRPGDEESVKTAIRGLGLDHRPVDRVVHLWCTGPVTDGETLDGRLAVLNTEYDRGFYTLLYAVQEIGLLQGSRHVRMDIAARGMHPVSTDAAGIVPDRALLAGPGLVVPQDFPAMSARTLDITGLPADGWSAELVAELLGTSTDTTVALTSGSRWVRCYERDELPPVPEGRLPLRLRENGVYLITGGLGGIGMTLAEYLVRACRARLVLTGMESVPDSSLWEDGNSDPLDSDDEALIERVARIRKLVALGGEIFAARCDAADREQTAGLFATVEKRFGRLDGVVHAAGVFETQRAFRGLDDTGREDCVRRLRPKVEGTLVLAEFLRGRKLDFVLMQSSLSSHLGGLGFYAYTAGNAFMDAFAERHRDADIPWMTVNWDGWIFRERDDDTLHQSVVSPSFASPDFGVVAEIAIRPSEGQDFYSRLMNMTEPHQVLISTADFERRIDQWVRAAAERQAPAAATDETAATAGTDIETGIAEIWTDVLGVGDLTGSSDFFALGGDSLLGVTVAHRLSLRFDVVLSVITMFDNPTIAQTAAEIRRLRGRAAAGGAK